MKSHPDCIVCLMRQALNTARIATPDTSLHHEVLTRSARGIPGLSLAMTPAGLSQDVYRIVSEVTGVLDPYARQKEETNAAAMSLMPTLREQITASRDPLSTILHAAVAGNIIDLGIGHAFDIEKDIVEIMKQPFAIDATDDFRHEMKPGRTALFLGDNAGEIVFDTLLVEKMIQAGMKVTYTVKSAPIINDATMKDAESVGMTRLCPVIETGSNDIGVNWFNASDEFRSAFEQADVVVAKGHGNFETCNERPGNIYFLLKAKCDIVARELRVPLGSIVFKHNAL